MAKPRRKGTGSEKWITEADQRMEQKGTKGSFTRAAKKAGRSVGEEISAVLKPGSKASTKMKKKAAFAKAMRKIAARKRKSP